ncbi:MAG: sel1 repeat family protein [Clostridia bacterium]|nr:sel1 repeat family protein [Clostridia bacterium]
MTIAYSEKINGFPETDGLDFINKLTVETLPLFFSSDVDETILKMKENYESSKNDAFRPAAARTEKALFRLYEAKYMILPHVGVDLCGFCFDDAYHDAAVRQTAECYDRQYAEAEYGAALAAVREKDYVTAGAHFKNAALCGHRDAQYNYGVSLSKGELGEPDPLEGAFWYFIAAKGGNAKAMVNLAIAYRTGRGVSANGPMMIYWYAKAATIPFPYAVYCLGLCLQNEEVLTEQTLLGRTLKVSSERLDEPERREFAVNVAQQIIKAIKDYTYHI